MGNYQVILSLLSSIDQGRERKSLVDTLIENCDQVINLREVILEARLQYSISGVDEKTRVVWLDRAVQAVSIGLRFTETCKHCLIRTRSSSDTSS
jgi:hypothetical protein